MTDYDLLCAQMKALLEDETHYLPGLSNAAALLYQELPDLNWAGFYLTLKDPDQSDGLSSVKELILGPFQGKTACIRIPYGKGVCGTGADDDTVQRVADVHAFPGHIACDSASASEIVIPLHDKAGQVVGVLDIDSPILNRFSAEDEAGLRRFARVLEEGCALGFV